MSDQPPASPISNIERTPPASPQPAPRTTFDAWAIAVTRPSPLTYQAIANSALASRGEVWIWVLIASSVSAFAGFLLDGQQAPASGTFSLSAAIGSAVGSAVGFWVGVWLLNWFARRFGGRASFNQAVYTLSAVYCPLLVAASGLSLLGLIPSIGFLFNPVLVLLLTFYQVVLMITAVKGMHQIGWVAATVSALLPPVALLVGIVVVLMIFGPLIGRLLGY